ncbi:hypothetical protein B0I35DRAFT_420813 [Stachybotrys elegans]|uniref:Transcription factor domain-containing protein n=1 Tax=Stachybotrys elegans TaxID=80388 RepID=A0A8K0SUU6_9HYPO|nr:hypothetical protein B0I35DRAFT_420813 [Stachybotrys elegans]
MQHHVIGHSGRLVKLPGGANTLGRPQVPQELNLAGFQDHIAFTFYFQRYRWAYFWQGIIRVSPADSSDLHYTASRAVVLGYLAKMNHDRELEMKAVQLSSQAVSGIQNMINNGSIPEQASILSAISAMGVYNYMFEPTFSYLHHYGLQMILKSCGPFYFQDEANLRRFRCCRKMLYCVALRMRCKTFLSRPEWKTVPFLFVKSTEDKIMDILVDIPGLVESINFLNRSEHHRDMAQRIRYIRAKLADWWVEWHSLNPNSASETVRYCGGNNLLPFIASFLSTNLIFETAQQGLELICYHSAMLLLGQVEWFLLGQSPDEYEILSMRDYGEKHPRGVPRRQTQTPLLLPEEIEHHWQHGLEGLRILSGFRASLEARSELYVTAGPLAILYCFARNLGIAEAMLNMISGEQWAEHAEVELGSYDFYKLGSSAQEMSNASMWRTDSGHSHTWEAETSVGSQLFINSSWP